MRRTSFTLLAIGVVLSVSGAALAELPPGGSFVDDDGNVHEGFIEAIAADGITRGCNPPINDRYCPNDPVRRDQMAAFLVRALSLDDDGGKDWFTDDDGSTFEADINRLAAAGITAGCNPPVNDQFCPGETVTRGQMAAFLVRAYGYNDAGDGDWFGDDDGDVFEGDIDRLAAAGVTAGCNPPVNDEFCPHDRVRRDQMASFLGRAEGLSPMVPPPAVAPTIEIVVTGLSSPVFVTAPPGDARLFVVEKAGNIRIVENDTLVDTPFLDIRDLVLNQGEQGLLGMAFHPEYASNGLFYVSYTDKGGDSRLVEYQVSADPDVADDGTARPILEVSQPYTNHNGGMILFAPDGYLMFGLGDGGSGGDPDENGQDTGSLLGSLLRIGVEGDDFPSDSGRNYTIPADNPFVGRAGADEIWAYGLRNPWRFSIDAQDGLIYIGDVGQSAWEEVDVASIDAAGLNYGWNSFEGNQCFDTGDGCDRTGKTFPALAYGRSEGVAVTGGYVYRGTELPSLVGHYFYADYGRGVLRSFRYVDGQVYAERIWNELRNLGSVSSFGVDNDGRLYMVNLTGELTRLAAAD